MQQQDLAAATAPSALPTLPRTLKIAIADDEPAIRQHFANALQQLGHTITAVAADGLELLQACQVERPELLITDIQMDRVSGIDVVRELSTGVPVPTILISALSPPEALLQELNGQVVAFLRKPVKLAALTAAVNKAVRNY